MDREARRAAVHGVKKSQTQLNDWTEDRIESSKEPEPVQLTWGMSEIAAHPPSPIADNPSALASPTSTPSSQKLFLAVHLIPAPACQLYYCTTVLFKVLYRKIKKAFFIFVVF